MRNIVVVECFSTGRNYIKDIMDRDYNPVVLEVKSLDDSFEGKRYQEDLEACYASIEDDFVLLHEKDSYEETLEMVREYDPLLVVPGSEKGVILATKLANDLNLLCNPIENIDAMTLKDKMHERLAENNVRSIRGRVVESTEEAIDFYDSEGLKKVVVKPVYSAGSVGVRLCNDKTAMIQAIDEVLSHKGVYGNDLSKLLIQEQIEGQEYVVNTVSCNGIHRVTSIWKYTKQTTSEGGQIYDYDEVLRELSIGETDLVEYAYDVLDAIGIKYGAVHGEYRIDENGPVLIEVNCRPHGSNMDAKYLNMIFGHHETDCSLDSYLSPKKFNLDRKNGYKTFAYGIAKEFIIPKDLVVKSSPISNIGVNLKSHYKTSVNFSESQFVSKTQDLETSGGSIYLVSRDYRQIRKDLEFLRNIEKRAFELVLSEEKNVNIDIDGAKINQNIKILLDNVEAFGSVLLVTEEKFEGLNIKQVTLDSLDEINGEFDCLIVNLNQSVCNESAECVSRILLDIFDKVKVGGLIFIPNSTYDFLPNGRLGAEALMKLLDFNLEIPMHKLTKMIIASKE
jgi:biotin carboxylase